MTPLIYLINNIIIIIFSKLFGLCLLFVTLKRLIPAIQSYDCHSIATLLYNLI